METTKATVPGKLPRRRESDDRWSALNRTPVHGYADIVAMDAPTGVSWPGDAGGAELIAEIEGDDQ